MLGSTYTLTGTNLPVNTPLVRIVSLVTGASRADASVLVAAGSGAPKFGSVAGFIDASDATEPGLVAM